MSRLGKKPIEVPTSVKFTIEGNTFSATGPKGTLSYTLPEGYSINQEGQNLTIVTESNDKNASAFWGLARAMVNNIVVGVSVGFKKELEIQGVGYSAAMQGKDKLALRLGFSHPVEYQMPQGVTCEVPADSRGTVIILTGADKQLVGQVAATIRSYRKPDPYLGKGVRYRGEQITLKEGKSVGK